MSSHQDSKTEKYTNSPPSSQVRHTQVARRYLEASELELLPETTILSRSLTLRTIISTSSSFSRRFHAAKFRPELQTINPIGAGLQATVFEKVGESLVMKKERPGNESLASNLTREYKSHCAISAAFDRFDPAINSNVHVPRANEFISLSDGQFWSTLPKFPSDHRTPTNILKMQRILPLPKVVRRSLIIRFQRQSHNMDPVKIVDILSDPENKHCLARIYLGQEQGAVPFTKLRNFPLFLSSMKELHLDVEELATAMGKAFAIMQWGAGIDGDDVEFVLGTSATADFQSDDFQHRAIGLYLLDFGQCQPIDLLEDSETVYQAFKGAMVTGDNRLFIPKDPDLYLQFRKGYVAAADLILKGKGLADRFNAEAFMREYEEYVEDLL